MASRSERARRQRAQADREKAKAQRIPGATEPLVNVFAAAHGDYHHESMPITAGELGMTKPGNVRVLRNRGGSAVERWMNSGSLTLGQAEAITLYARSWRLFIGEQRIVANWGLTATIRGMSASEWVDCHTEAEAMIRHIDAVVFKAIPTLYVECWKNVVLFDEAAGLVGARLGFKHKGAEASAKMMVLFIADMIATYLRLGIPF